MTQHFLTDEQWTRLEPLLPPPASNPGRPRHDDRQIIDGILWRDRTGAPWRVLPQAFGPWQTVYARFRLWQRAGAWERVLPQLQRMADAQGQVDGDLHCLDATSIRAHQHAAGGKKGAITASDAAAVDSAPHSTSVPIKRAN